MTQYALTVSVVIRQNGVDPDGAAVAVDELLRRRLGYSWVGDVNVIAAKPIPPGSSLRSEWR